MQKATEKLLDRLTWIVSHSDKDVQGYIRIKPEKITDIIDKIYFAETQVSKAGKFNIWDMCKRPKSDGNYYLADIVHYENGKASATNGHTVCEVEMEYDKKLEGRTVDKNCEDSSSRWPDVGKFLAGKGGMEFDDDYSIDLDKAAELRRKAAAMLKQHKRADVYVCLRDKVTMLNTFALMCEFMRGFGTREIHMKDNDGFYVRGEKGHAFFIMCTREVIEKMPPDDQYDDQAFRIWLHLDC